MLRRSFISRQLTQQQQTIASNQSISMKECLNRITFRDTLLSIETRGRQGARIFQGFPGLSRELVAMEIINQFASNRVSSFHGELRELQVDKVTHEDMLDTDLLLTSSVHSVFGRNRAPVSFILDVDAKHESEEETQNWRQFEDRLLGLLLVACRNAFSRHYLKPKKVCILTAGDGTKPYASLHLHIDFTDTAFVDSSGIANFIRGELTTEIRNIGQAYSSSSSSSSNNTSSSSSSSTSSSSSSSTVAKFAKRLIHAIDAQPFSAIGGSLRVYGAPKLDGSRPCRLYRPIIGGAAATALNALGATEGGPTIQLMQQQTQLRAQVLASMTPEQKEKMETLLAAASSAQNGENKHMIKESALEKAISSMPLRVISSAGITDEEERNELISRFDVLKNIQRSRTDGRRKSDRERREQQALANPGSINEAILGAHGLPVVRQIELEALAMSLGTPDWLSLIPFRFVSFNKPSTRDRKIDTDVNSKDSSNSATKNSSSSSSHRTFHPDYPGRHLSINTEGLPPYVLADIQNASNKHFPAPVTLKPHPETLMLLAIRCVEAYPEWLAAPYLKWLSVGLALSEIAAYTMKVGGRETRADVLLERAFVDFSRKSPSNFDEAACVKLFRKAYEKRLNSREGQITAKSATDSYRALLKKFQDKKE